MLQRLSIALAIFFAMTSAAAAELSVSRLNELISLMRLHSGVMEGPVRYSYVGDEGFRTKLSFWKDKKDVPCLRIEVVEVAGRIIKAGRRTEHTKTFYVASYEDREVDGTVDKVAVRYLRKKDAKDLRGIISTDPQANQDWFESILESALKHLRNVPTA